MRDIEGEPLGNVRATDASFTSQMKFRLPRD